MYSQQMRNRPGVELSPLRVAIGREIPARRYNGTSSRGAGGRGPNFYTLYDSVESISIPQYIGDDWKSMNFVLVKLFKRNNKTSPFHILSHQVKQLSHKRPFHNYFVFSYIYIYIIQYTISIQTNEHNRKKTNKQLYFVIFSARQLSITIYEAITRLTDTYSERIRLSSSSTA